MPRRTRRPPPQPHCGNVLKPYPMLAHSPTPVWPTPVRPTLRPQMHAELLAARCRPPPLVALHRRCDHKGLCALTLPTTYTCAPTLYPQVHAELVALYRRRDRTSRSSEWPLLSADLLALAAPWGPGVDGGGGSSSSSSSSRSSSTEQKLLVHGRMMRTYTVFQR